MAIPFMPQTKLILTKDIPQEPDYQGLRILRCQSDPDAARNYSQNLYQFLHQRADYTPLRATLTRKGSPNSYRLVAVIHPTMRVFYDIVKYDPANPRRDDYEAQGMQRAHERTQSDFKGQKKANTDDFRNYILEGVRGDRTLFLPTVSGWQSKKVFEKTVFAAFDEGDPNAMYGMLYLPRAPIMQADGQTQTAAIFQVVGTVDAIESGALDTVTLTIEVELNVDEVHAAQSFADRNGRGSKKNKNLVISFDTSSALSKLRAYAMEETIFEGRLADGRNTGTTEKATGAIVDLSTMEQILLNVISGGARKPEQIKHHHVKSFLPYAKEFLKLLEDVFGEQWPSSTPPDKDPFRRVYIHGWPFALKGLALAYHLVRINELGPMALAIGTETEDNDASRSVEDKYLNQVKLKAASFDRTPPITFEEFKSRLQMIDWRRYRAHWVNITGYAMKDGKKKTIHIKGEPEEKVVALAPNVASTISAVRDKVLSPSWRDLCSDQDEPLD